jgi:glycosyltransferase involved in cell wall biosynthesis
MKNRITYDSTKSVLSLYTGTVDKVLNYSAFPLEKRHLKTDKGQLKAEILFITSYPPRECGIATYSQDLISALNKKFSHSLSIKVCALESGEYNYSYPSEVKYILKTSLPDGYETLASAINKDDQIKIVLIEHEFGFYKRQTEAFLLLIHQIKKPVVIAFHTVLPNPSEEMKQNISQIAAICESVVVMTHTSAKVLMKDYGVAIEKISIIAHGTHLVQHTSKNLLKASYNLTDRKVLVTFGLLSSGKSLETTLDALPAIISKCPDVIFLILGKTHPEVVKEEGEKYREMLEQKVYDLSLQAHVTFVNHYLSLAELLDYLQLADVYLFTSSDPNQAVSGTFVYAMSCACPIISTPIPHALEVLTKDTGIIIDFQNPVQLAGAVNRLLSNNELCHSMSINTLQKTVSTAWENSAVAHALLFEKIAKGTIVLKYNWPIINLDHLRQMTTEVGMIQFSIINQPDLHSGYTLDDNARALVSMAMLYKESANEDLIDSMSKYLNFIKFCQQPKGDFLNYLDRNKHFTSQNIITNLDDSNGRAIWALGYLMTLKDQLPEKIIKKTMLLLDHSLDHLSSIHSTRAMAFSIKGLYYYQTAEPNEAVRKVIVMLANRLMAMYKSESSQQWQWFESYLTYANSILPEAMLYAWKMTGERAYKDTAVESLQFLLSKIFNENGIEVISNKKWLRKGERAEPYGEQPIDVAYTIMTLNAFYKEFREVEYRAKMNTAFNWFLGENRLHQIVYNPSTGGCYDGLEEFNVNLNQGAESTLSYLMARLTMEENKDMPKRPMN